MRLCSFFKALYEEMTIAIRVEEEVKRVGTLSNHDEKLKGWKI